MKITITPQASQWFQDEVGLESGDSLRFLGKVYGKTEVHQGFSIGMSVESPKKPLASIQKNRIVYFVEKQDEWFFDGYDLLVEYSVDRDEPIYHFIENRDAD